jgi:hypothetical protein
VKGFAPVKLKRTEPVRVKPVVPDWAWDVTLNWSRPADYRNIDKGGFPSDNDAWFYMILGRLDSSDRELFYIGRVFQTCVSQRLRQRDHRKRFKELEGEYPEYHFEVSLAKVDLNGRINFNRIDEIERILICTACQSHKHMVNKRERFSYPKTLLPYIIHNRGSRRPLPEAVFVGIFSR